MLVGAAADRWNIDPASCDTADGFVINGVRTFTFGELAEEAADRIPPLRAALRQSAKARLIGQPLQRLDGPAKADGSWRFAGDVRLPGMLYASVRIAPPGGRLTGFLRDAVSQVRGVRHITANDRWIAVVAESWWTAEQALKAADPKYSAARTPADLRPVFDAALAEGKAQEWFSRGDYGGVTRGSRPLAATYYAAPSLHLGIEPVVATARVGGSTTELWAPAQAPGFGQDAHVTLYPMAAGEPSGQAMESEAAPIAIELARVLGRPVQVMLSAAQARTTIAPRRAH